MPRVRPHFILLPGLDGTGNLFTGFATTFADYKVTVVRYATDRPQTEEQLLQLIGSSIEVSESVVLIAESFSSPLAIKYAAMRETNVIALIICSGFVTSPLRGWLRDIVLLLAPILFHFPIPSALIRYFLTGHAASDALVKAVKDAIRSVGPNVLSHRLKMTLESNALSALHEVDIPLLVIQAKQDRLVTHNCVEEVQRIRPQASIEYVSGPHLLLQARPITSAEVITSFLQQHSLV